MDTVSFPGLGLEVTVKDVALTLPLVGDIYWYGILIAAGFLLGILYVMRRVKQFGLNADRVVDVILGGAILSIVGARLYYVAFTWENFRDRPLDIVLAFKDGGLAIYGGIIGALIGAAIMCKWRRVKLLPMLDLATAGFFLGQAVGRWGNFINVEAFGSNTTMPWGMTSSRIANYLARESAKLEALGVSVDPAMPVHPTFLYESLWCLLGFVFLAWFTKRRRFDGQMSLLYLGWYGLGRFFIEGLRTDSLLIGTLRVSQILALLCVVGAAIALVVVYSRIRSYNDPAYLQLYANTPEGQAAVDGSLYEKKAPEEQPENDSDSREDSTDQGEAEEPDKPEEAPAQSPDGEEAPAAAAEDGEDIPGNGVDSREERAEKLVQESGDDKDAEDSGEGKADGEAD